MGRFPGRQRVGIEFDMAALDGDGEPILSEFGEPQTVTSTRWVDGCLFEVPSPPDEQQGQTVTTAEIGWAILPVSSDGVIPTTYGPLPFLDADGNPSISSSERLIHQGLRYAMRGDAVMEYDLRGRPDHIFCRCERQRG